MRNHYRPWFRPEDGIRAELYKQGLWSEPLLMSQAELLEAMRRAWERSLERDAEYWAQKVEMFAR